MTFTDGRRIESGSTLATEVCVVGAGAAGITLALALARRGTSVILLEAGDWHADRATQKLQEGRVTDPDLHSPPQFYRSRRFGGTTTIWSGRCVPFDPIDFERRDFMPHSGWPIEFEDLAHFYPEANAICEAGACRFRVADALPGARAEMIPGFRSELVETDGLERFSRPTDFGRKYAQPLTASRKIRVVLNSNVTQLHVAPDSQKVERLDVATLTGRKFAVRAKRFVLATGGLEVTRLLLASRGVYREGIGNEHGLVGKFYMCHIAGTLGRLTFTSPPPRDFHGYELSPGGIYCRRRFQLAAPVQRSLGIGNCIARVHHPQIADPSHRTGPLSALYLAKNLLPHEFSKRVNDGEHSPANLARHLRNLAADPVLTVRFFSNWLFRRTLASRKFPSVIVTPRSNCFTLDFHSEQAPNPDSRLRLSDTNDALGMPQIHVDWRYLPLDVLTVKESFRVLGGELARTCVGQLSFEDHEVEAAIRREGAYGGHHLGTTRMSVDSRLGVVDRDCRVHGIENLFIASGSVFPTSSQANPTLTIVALALRLAEHLVHTADAPIDVGALDAVQLGLSG